METCDRPVRARGWCSAHYERWRRGGNLYESVPVGAIRRIPRKATFEKCWNLADRISDMLAVDGEWWTLQALAERFDAHPDSILRSARQLEADELIERRHVLLATTVNGRGHDHRIEWRAV